MKNPTLFALSAAIVAILGLRGFTSPAFAGLTVAATLPRVGTVFIVSTPPSPTRTVARPLYPPSSASQTTTPTRNGTPGATPSVTSPVESLTPANGTSVTPTSTPRYTLTLDPQSLSVESLRARSYGGGPIKVTQVVSDDPAFKRVLFEYSSDGLRITGMMHIPSGSGPFPVVILDHGYFKPSEYRTGDGTAKAADYFARHGYLTLAPDYRCYGGSQCSSNPLDVGYAVDVLNLIGSLGSLPNADPSRVGIWGHSMGGGVTARVLVISDRIKVAALYGAVSADDEVHYCWLSGCPTPSAATREPKPPPESDAIQVDPDFIRGIPTPIPAAPDRLGRLREIFARSSPSRFLARVTASVIIHHGEKDSIVPIEWSVDLAEQLNAKGVPAALYTYPGEGHVFAGWNWQLFMARTVALFDKFLNPRETPITAEMRVLRQERAILDSSY